MPCGPQGNSVTAAVVPGATRPGRIAEDTAAPAENIPAAFWTNLQAAEALPAHTGWHAGQCRWSHFQRATGSSGAPSRWPYTNSPALAADRPAPASGEPEYPAVGRPP